MRVSSAFLAVSVLGLVALMATPRTARAHINVVAEESADWVFEQRREVETIAEPIVIEP